MLKLYNTLTRKKEVFKPIHKDWVGVYTCGPTVYDYAHIGNLRAYIFEDILVRWLTYRGYKIKRVMNYTDVGHLTSDSDTGEDKMEKGSKREHKTAWEIADFYIKAFLTDIRKLNIIIPKFTPRATEFIQEQVDFVKKLEEKGYTYIIEDGVYFDTSKFKNYGQLAKLDIKGLQAGARIEVAKGKKNITDFALWKLTPNGERRQMEWGSPWGKGFPGWHLECSAMALALLGETIDIHCGGIDHIPVHHTNEIAQSESLTGKPFARFWMHGEFLLFNDGKMAKSAGGFITLKAVEEKSFSPLDYRLMVLGAHYREKLNFTWKSLESSKNTLKNLEDFLFRLMNSDAKKSAVLSKKIEQLNQKTLKNFESFLDDDLNAPRALATLFDYIKQINVYSQKTQLTEKEVNSINVTLEKMNSIFAILPKVSKIKLSSEQEKLIKQREIARKEKDFQTADAIRESLAKTGLIVEDTQFGLRWRKK